MSVSNEEKWYFIDLSRTGDVDSKGVDKICIRLLDLLGEISIPDAEFEEKYKCQKPLKTSRIVLGSTQEGDCTLGKTLLQRNGFEDVRSIFDPENSRSTKIELDDILLKFDHDTEVITNSLQLIQKLIDQALWKDTGSGSVQFDEKLKTKIENNLNSVEVLQNLCEQFSSLLEHGNVLTLEHQVGSNLDSMEPFKVHSVEFNKSIEEFKILNNQTQSSLEENKKLQKQEKVNAGSSEPKETLTDTQCGVTKMNLDEQMKINIGSNENIESQAETSPRSTEHTKILNIQSKEDLVQDDKKLENKIRLNTGSLENMIELENKGDSIESNGSMKYLININQVLVEPNENVETKLEPNSGSRKPFKIFNRQSVDLIEKCNLKNQVEVNSKENCCSTD